MHCSLCSSPCSGRDCPQVLPLVPVDEVPDLAAFVNSGGLALWQPHCGGGPGPLAMKISALHRELGHLEKAERTAQHEAAQPHSDATRNEVNATQMGEGEAVSVEVGGEPGGTPVGGSVPPGVLEVAGGARPPESGMVSLRVCCLDVSTVLAQPFSTQCVACGPSLATHLHRLTVEPLAIILNY